METRKSFYDDEMIYERMDEVLRDVCSKLTLKEVLKMIREISYDMVCYYGEDNKGIIYQKEEYSSLNREQACQIQRMLSTACDLFCQSVVQHREFDEGYLNKWLNGGAMEFKINELEEKIKMLEEQLYEKN